ncbi:helix-turn-helix domain-containing protein [Nocardia suismassiliense]|uniref:helix-turn-helix domain-containing protein n=1 Tax=Nocardia suismassiliense TaxID=2077092 RepID=UPI000D1E4634|nr:helix-turn-helix transcriptional regulator [Nocardia suismassiliense]
MTAAHIGDRNLSDPAVGDTDAQGDDRLRVHPARRSANADTIAVGSVIRAYRLSKTPKWTQKVLADKMGMTQQHLSNIEKGLRTVLIPLRRRFAEVLDIPPEQLGLSEHSRIAMSQSQPATAPDVGQSCARWLAEREWLNNHRGVLATRAADWYPASVRVRETSLIAPPEWLPDEPVELDSISLELIEPPVTATITGREATTLPLRPLRAPAIHFDSYTAAIGHLNRPRLFESRPSFRYLGGSLGEAHMRFGLGAYFDKLDVSEALGHELAVACMTSDATSPTPWHARLPFRESIDPFDPLARAIIPAITTLTIRRRRVPAEPSFLLHWRDPSRVATAAGVFDVIPAGEFQPSTVALWDRGNDFGIWKQMVREYSEELLGAPEHDGTRTQAIDYEGWDLYRALTDARSDGRVRAYALAMGLDALTLAATILTVTVIDDDVFTELFGETVRYNDEGEIVGVNGKPGAEGIPFTEESVADTLAHKPMAAPGAAALMLAWEHRDLLLN